jgi:hypothetical protein
VFGPFFEIFPEKFQNKTNGVTPRRWLAFSNPPLRQLITDTLGSERWINDTEQLKVRGGGVQWVGGWGRVGDVRWGAGWMTTAVGSWPWRQL